MYAGQKWPKLSKAIENGQKWPRWTKTAEIKFEFFPNFGPLVSRFFCYTDRKLKTGGEVRNLPKNNFFAETD